MARQLARIEALQSPSGAEVEHRVTVSTLRLTHHLEDIGALHRQGREPCPGPLLVHLLNLAECHAPGACGLHYRWHPPNHLATLLGSTRPLLIRCDDCGGYDVPRRLAVPGLIAFAVLASVTRPGPGGRPPVDDAGPTQLHRPSDSPG